MVLFFPFLFFLIGLDTLQTLCINELGKITNALKSDLGYLIYDYNNFNPINSVNIIEDEEEIFAEIYFEHRNPLVLLKNIFKKCLTIIEIRSSSPYTLYDEQEEPLESVIEYILSDVELYIKRNNTVVIPGSIDRIINNHDNLYSSLFL